MPSQIRHYAIQAAQSALKIDAGITFSLQNAQIMHSDDRSLWYKSTVHTWWIVARLGEQRGSRVACWSPIAGPEGSLPSLNVMSPAVRGKHHGASIGTNNTVLALLFSGLFLRSSTQASLIFTGCRSQPKLPLPLSEESC